MAGSESSSSVSGSVSPGIPPPSSPFPIFTSSEPVPTEPPGSFVGLLSASLSVSFASVRPPKSLEAEISATFVTVVESWIEAFPFTVNSIGNVIFPFGNIPPEGISPFVIVAVRHAFPPAGTQLLLEMKVYPLAI